MAEVIKGNVKKIKNNETSFRSRNGSRIMLPDGVGFKMGKNTKIQHLVLQVIFKVI